MTGFTNTLSTWIILTGTLHPQFGGALTSMMTRRVPLGNFESPNVTKVLPSTVRMSKSSVLSSLKMVYRTGRKACLRLYFATLRPRTTPATLEKW